MRALPLALLLLITGSCSKQPEPARRQILVLRFQNLTGSAALDWMERGAPAQLAAQMADTSLADSAYPAEERERAAVTGTTRVLHGYISKTGDRLRLRADLEDARSKTFVKSAEAAGLSSSGLLPLANEVARQLDPAARPYGARSEAALEAYVTGENATDPASAMEAMKRAIAADPNFGAAYLALVRLSAAQRDRASVERYVAAARSRGEAITPIDRARLDVMAAQAAENPAALSQALNVLAKLAPADANLLRSLANAELAAKRYPQAIAYFQKVIAIEPDDAASLNTLGYTYAYAGDLSSAVRVLGDYEKARPSEANPLDSLAEVYFYFGKFAESEKAYRRAYEKDRSFLNGAPLMKAGFARLLTGDGNGAESIFQEYESARRTAQDPAIDFARARWDYFRGHRADAIPKLRSFAGTTAIKETAALADCTLAVWTLEAGSQPKSAACRFLADPQVPAPTVVVRAYVLLLTKHFEEAVPLLREILARTPPRPTDTTPTLLAWALTETGHAEEAEKYLQSTPTPVFPAIDPFESLAIPRIFHLRGTVAAKKGQPAEAARNEQLYKTLSGA